MDISTAERVGNEIRAYFNAQGITQQEVAERLGIAQTGISARLCGLRPFGKNAAARWSEVFGFSRQFLCTGEGSLIESKGDDEAKSVAIVDIDAKGKDETFLVRLCHELVDQIIERDRRICCLEEELKNEREKNDDCAL